MGILFTTLLLVIIVLVAFYVVAIVIQGNVNVYKSAKKKPVVGTMCGVPISVLSLFVIYHTINAATTIIFHENTIKLFAS